jgi:hypothetical protein
VSDDLEARVARLETEVADLQSERSGRRAKPIVASIDGVCGVDPSRDSSACPDASLYRRQQGCKGSGCKAEASRYWSNYRRGKRVVEGLRKPR